MADLDFLHRELKARIGKPLNKLGSVEAVTVTLARCARAT
jgi:hypothetical protein